MPFYWCPGEEGKGRDEVRKNQVVAENYLFMEKCKEA